MLPRDINKKFRANDSALTASSPADSTRQVSCIRDSECRVLPYDQQIAYRDRSEKPKSTHNKALRQASVV